MYQTLIAYSPPIWNEEEANTNCSTMNVKISRRVYTHADYQTIYKLNKLINIIT